MASSSQTLPLSGPQRGIWLDQAINLGLPLYNLCNYVHVEGLLDVPALVRALEHVVRSNDALRLVLVEEDGVPGQRIAEHTVVAVVHHDLPGSNDAAAEAWLRRELARPFDLDGGPLLRLVVLRISEARYTWALQHHHAINDGWGAMLVFQRIVAAYNALASGQPLPPAPNPSYADFVADDLAYAASEQFQRDAAFWQETYRRLPAPLLPRRGADGPRRSTRMRVDRGAFAELRSFAAAHGSTPFKVILGLLYCYFVRVGRRDDFPVGFTTLNRSTEDFRRTAGMFTNVVPAWYRLGSALSFRELLRALDAEAQRAAPHRRFPIDELKRRVGAARSEHARLFDVIVTYLAGTYEARLGDTPVSLGFMPNLAPEILAIQVTQGEDGLEVLFDACPTIMTVDDGARLPPRLERLLRSILDGADVPIRDLQLVPETELAQLTAWNHSSAAYPADACIHELFEAQARRSPDAVAVLFERSSLTYAELDARANRLAHHLRALGVGPETRVGLCLERSLELVVAILAVLKAGGAYVPLDPDYPSDRLRFMLTDARAPVLLTRTRLADRAAVPGTHVVCLDADPSPGSTQPDARPPRDVSFAHLAYVIYTSGSTGQPKGVGVIHQAVVNQIVHEAKLLGLRPGVPVLQFASVSFDASVSQIFATLGHGGRLVLASDEQRHSREALTALLRERAVEVADLPPGALSLVDPDAELQALRVVIVGGEACPAATIAPLARGRRVMNCYGPTETTITAATWEGRPPPTGSLPLGRANANNRLHVLSPALHQAPIGVPGELHIAGIGLARGYLGRPGLTAERFVPDPFGPPGSRMYRTGDLARWNDDGDLEFLGRLDHQVKVRGFRIELGEIEAALARHASVVHCVVVARQDADGTRLVAYVASPSPPSAAQLREHLARSLPDHMIPATFVLLDALPLTPGGKVDREALPAPEAVRPASGEHVAPRSPTERVLVDLWEELLGVDGLGVTDDFFALGGHSLLAVRVLSAVKARLGRAPAMASLFAHPTIEALGCLLDGGDGAAPAGMHPVARAAGEPAFPGLSGAERRMWFLERLHPGVRSYQVPQLLRVPGPLDEPALRHSLAALAARHEILRTRYPEHGGIPVRDVSGDARPTLRVVDLSARPLAEQGQALAALVSAEVAAPFDLELGPLTRVLAVALSPEEHLVLLLQHHIVTDEWSAAILLREWSALHAAAQRGADAALPPVPFQYEGFARAEHDALAGGGLSDARAYWKQQLADLPRLSLPIVQPHRGDAPGPEARITVPVDPDLHAGLLALARAHACTAFIAYFAAFSALLSRHAGLADISLGAVLANRDAPGSDRVPGFFTNTVVLRLALSGDPSFRVLLTRARTTAVDAYRHQALPFDIVVQDQGLPRLPGQNPVYDISFFEATNTDDTAWSQGPAALLDGTITAKDPLSLALLQHPGGASLSLAYDISRVDARAARRLLGHLLTLLQGALASPDVALSRLDILTPPELAQLAAWNHTAAAYPADACIHELFEAQALRTPDAVAVLFERSSLTYAELDARADRLAGHLIRDFAVGPEVRVALCVERSLDMMVGLLAVLKAGGVVVPIDPSYPDERRTFMLSDACAAVMLTQRRFTDRPAPPRTPVLCLDADDSSWAATPCTRPARAAAPDNAAYVIYTSGSTGRPKGSVLAHRGLTARVSHQRAAFPIGASDRVLQHASIAFDGAVFDWISALCNGATLVLLGRRGAEDGTLDAVLETHGITVAFVPPALLATLSCRAPDLRLLVIAGDTTPPELARRWAPGRTLLNSYGPSEASIYVTEHVVDPAASGAPPIGRPIANIAVHLVDDALRLVPVGVVGELCVSGTGLARGYWNRPGLTAERFIPDPFGPPGSRMYRTGDLARWNDDGNLEFRGRRDHQVKVRGFRVELGEIEAALARHASVAHCVVVARQDAGDTRLVAYVASPSPPSAVQLREHLSGSLPDYMVPATFVFLDALPLTPSGKADRKALPAPELDRAAASTGFVAPRDAAEAALATIWSAVLGMPEVGVHDNFFELGGHSLLAVQLVGRLRAALGRDVSVGTLFAAPTVARLARALESGGDTLAVDDDGIARAPRDRTSPLSYSQERIWRLAQRSDWTSSSNMTMALRLAGPLDSDALVAALAHLIERHEALRTAIVPEDDEWCQRILPTARLEDVRGDLSRLAPAAQAAEVQARLARQFGHGFGTPGEPLFLVQLLTLGPDRHVLALTMHHAVCDGWSMGVLMSELRAVYGSLRLGRAPELASLPLQPVDFATWERGWLVGAVRDRLLGYWRDRLRDAPMLALPTDRPRPEVLSDRGAVVAFALGAELSQQLEVLARTHDATLFMVLLAAWQLLLGHYSGQRDVVVGTLVANRTRSDVEGTIGCFINLLALRTDLSGDPTFTDLLGRVRETVLGAFEHQAAPIDLVVDALGAARGPGRRPLFQVMLVLQNTPSAAHPIADELVVEPLASDHEQVSRFDLMLSITPTDAGLRGILRYATDLYEAATIERVRDDLRAWLERIVAAPRVATSELLERARPSALGTSCSSPNTRPSASSPATA